MGLTYTPEAAAVLRALPPTPKRRIRDALTLLAKDPRHPSLDIRNLDVEGAPPVLRLRVGEYRVVYVVLGRATRVVRIFHRRDGYGWLERKG
jgi:mRNA-degrading endonuclease RelE of RelBE toxin-antitoxin system